MNRCALFSGVPGPTARSGHRMVLSKKHLVLFGGFHDTLAGETKYFNDVHIYDTIERKWRPASISGTAPSPRSACCMFAMPDGRILVYGGFCKEKVVSGSGGKSGKKSDTSGGKKAVEKGKILSDMFILAPDSKFLKYHHVEYE